MAAITLLETNGTFETDWNTGMLTLVSTFWLEIFNIDVKILRCGIVYICNLQLAITVNI